MRVSLLNVTVSHQCRKHLWERRTAPAGKFLLHREHLMPLHFSPTIATKQEKNLSQREQWIYHFLVPLTSENGSIFARAAVVTTLSFSVYSTLVHSFPHDLQILIIPSEMWYVQSFPRSWLNHSFCRTLSGYQGDKTTHKKSLTCVVLRESVVISRPAQSTHSALVISILCSELLTDWRNLVHVKNSPHVRFPYCPHMAVCHFLLLPLLYCSVTPSRRTIPNSWRDFCVTHRTRLKWEPCDLLCWVSYSVATIETHERVGICIWVRVIIMISVNWLPKRHYEGHLSGVVCRGRKIDSVNLFGTTWYGFPVHEITQKCPLLLFQPF